MSAWRENLDIIINRCRNKEYNPSLEDAKRIYSYYEERYSFGEENMTFEEAEELNCKLEELKEYLQNNVSGFSIDDYDPLEDIAYVEEMESSYNENCLGEFDLGETNFGNSFSFGDESY